MKLSRSRPDAVDAQRSNEDSRLSEQTKRNSDQGDKDQESDGQGQQDGKIKDEEQQQNKPPEPVGFWDPRLKHVRKEAMLKWMLTTAFLMAFIIGILSIYWGALFHVEKNLSSLVIYVVDFDGQVAPYTGGREPVVGPAITNLARSKVAAAMPNLGYGVLPASDFANDPIQVRQAVYDFEAWAAIIINPNATAMLYSAIENGNASYDPIGACQLVYVDSRDDTNWYDYISPLLTAFMTEAVSTVGQTFTGTIMEQAATNVTLVRNAAIAPQALSPAIGFSQYSLRPFYPYQVIPSVSIGLIYLIIVSFFSFAFYLPIHFKVSVHPFYLGCDSLLMT